MHALLVFFCKDNNSCHKRSITRKVGLDSIQNLTYEEKNVYFGDRMCKG